MPDNKTASSRSETIVAKPIPEVGANQAVIRVLVETIELIRTRRRDQWPLGSHPDGKRFTQDELRDEVYPSYKHLLQGKTQRLPSRETIGLIADYLECPLSERNDILVAAQYIPEQMQLSAEQIRAVLEQAHAILAILPLPAIVVLHDWTITHANPGFLHLYRLPALEQLAPVQRNLLHLVFDPTLAYRACHSPSAHHWRVLASQSVALFRQMNRLTLFEPQVQAQLQALRQLPDFSTIWNQTHASGATLPPTVTFQPLNSHAHAIYRFLAITPSGDLCPGVLALVPVDAAARAAFAAAGCSGSADNWTWMSAIESLS